jgi:hypothetical protein
MALAIYHKNSTISGNDVLNKGVGKWSRTLVPGIGLGQAGQNKRRLSRNVKVEQKDQTGEVLEVSQKLR